MRKSRFTESQIVSILKDGEAGVPLGELVRKHGISRATSAGATVADLKRMKEFEAENATLKRMYADLSLGERGHQGRPQPKTVTPAARRQVIKILTTEHRLSVRRACRVAGLAWAAWYQPLIDPAVWESQAHS